MKPFAVLLLLAAMSGCSALGHGSGAESVDARTALEALGSVEGDWSGEVLDGPWINEGGGGEGVEQDGGVRPVEGRYHVTAGCSVVEATLFQGTPRETVMMFHLDDGKLMLTQYGEAPNSATLVADMFGPTISDPPGPTHVAVRVGNETKAREYDVDVVAPQTSGEPDGVWIRFSRTRTADTSPSDGEYLHHVVMLITKNGTQTYWTFYEDGAPTKAVYVELTKRNSPQAVAGISLVPPPTAQ
jgi:hypothetical protein